MNRTNWEQKEICLPGTMTLGVNYWASHAATNMWLDWREDIIAGDMKRLHENGIRVLRVFPLWRDFQPLTLHRSGRSEPREIRMGDRPLPFTEAGKAGVSEEMLRRLERFLDLAQENGLKVLLSLVTGWMSGGTLVPPAFEGMNPLTDPFVIRWEIRFVQCIVRSFKNHPALWAWELGNECNCMGKLNNADEMFVWMSTIGNAIRSADSGHMLISGITGLYPGTAKEPADMGEVSDIVTSHPYPAFTPYCATDPIIGMKNGLQAVADSVMCQGMCGKPCLTEEIGTLGPFFASEQNAADYLQGVLLGLWRHDGRGLMWWCAFDQDMHEFPPYDWGAIERELGLLTQTREKPVIRAMRRFSEMTERFGGILLPRITDAVCILSEYQDTWAAAYGSMLLAVQAKLDLRFCSAAGEIPEAQNYMLPSLTSDYCVKNHVMHDLLGRVESGANLYLSINDAVLSPFESYTGLQPQYRKKTQEKIKVSFEGSEYELPVEAWVTMTAGRAEVIARTDSGEPFMSCSDYGKGKVYFINAPIELIMAKTPEITDGKAFQPLYRLYRKMDLRSKEKHFDADAPLLGLTEHPDGRETILAVQSYAKEDAEFTVFCDRPFSILSCDSVSQKARITETGNGWLKAYIPHHDACLMKIKFTE